jgi:hypothetical protein
MERYESKGVDMTRPPLKTSVSLATAAALAALAFSTAARIPCDNENPTRGCHTVVSSPVKPGTPRTPASPRRKARANAHLASAAIARALKTGQMGGAYNPRLADG